MKTPGARLNYGLQLGFKHPAQKPSKPQTVQSKIVKESGTTLGSLGFLANKVQASHFRINYPT